MFQRDKNFSLLHRKVYCWLQHSKVISCHQASKPWHQKWASRGRDNMTTWHVTGVSSESWALKTLLLLQSLCWPVTPIITVTPTMGIPACWWCPPPPSAWPPPPCPPAMTWSRTRTRCSETGQLVLSVKSLYSINHKSRKHNIRKHLKTCREKMNIFRLTLDFKDFGFYKPKEDREFIL